MLNEGGRGPAEVQANERKLNRKPSLVKGPVLSHITADNAGFGLFDFGKM